MKKQQENSDAKKIAQKIKMDNTIPVRYIKQPFPISAMYGDLTLQQTHIVVEMMDILQEKVDKLFKVHKENGTEMILFSDEEFDEDGLANIDVKFSSLASRPDSYRDVEKITAGLMSSFIKIEDEEADGEVQLEHFLDSIRYPKKGSKRDVVRFRFTKPQARRIFNYKRYSKYLKHVARNAKSKHTARLYMLITTNRELGKWYVSYAELRRILGCDVYDEQKKEYVVKRCAQYKHFKSDVLRVAENELKELADNNLADCYFDFEEIFPHGKKTGDPEKFVFNIYKSQMGELEDLRAKNNVRFYDLQQFMQNQFDMTYAECMQIVNKIDDDIYEQFSIRVHEINESIIKQGDKILSKKKYAIKSLNEALAEFTPEITPMDENPEVVPPKIEEKDKAEIKVPQLDEETKERWKEFLHQLSVDSPNTYDFWKSSLRLSSVSDNILNIVLPNSFFKEEFDKRYKTEINKSFVKVYGENVKISYIMNPEQFQAIEKRDSL